MNKYKRKLYKFLSTEKWNDSAIFFLRLFVGIMMLTHGVTKIRNYNMLFDSFPDPIGWGSRASLMLIISVEVLGSLLLIAGLFVRPAAFLLASGMFFATFLVFPEKAFMESELSFIYMGIYITLLISGGAKYSLDRFWFRVR